MFPDVYGYLQRQGQKAPAFTRGMNGLQLNSNRTNVLHCLVDTLHLANSIVFGSATVHRPRGQQHERSLDGGAVRDKSGCCRGHTRPARHEPSRGAGQAPQAVRGSAGGRHRISPFA